MCSILPLFSVSNIPTDCPQTNPDRSIFIQQMVSKFTEESLDHPLKVLESGQNVLKWGQSQSHRIIMEKESYLGHVVEIQLYANSGTLFTACNTCKIPIFSRAPNKPLGSKKLSTPSFLCTSVDCWLILSGSWTLTEIRLKYSKSFKFVQNEFIRH